MRSIVIDKLASVASDLGADREIRVGDRIPSEEGVMVAVEVLNEKSSYNQLELASGRMARVRRGDVVVGALGHRKALFGYSGHVPATTRPGDTVQILNMGGVLGICDAVNASLGQPFDARVLGVVLEFPYLGERVGVPARVGGDPLDTGARLELGGVPVVALAGTCMNSGKTAAACAVIGRLRHKGHVVDAFKATGVSLRRDILAMEDAGARNTSIFTDFGVVSTGPGNAPELARTMLRRLAAECPDAIVFELGDGILGAYGVEAILRDDAVRANISCLVLCASDPVAAWGGARLLEEEFGMSPAFITGPATDNQVGLDIIRERTGLEGVNAVTHGARLGDAVAARIGLGAHA